MSTTATNHPTITDAQLKFMNPVFDDYQQSDYSEESSERLRTFLHAALRAHPEPPIDAYLTYFAGDPAKGREILERLGPDATFSDLADAVKNGTIQ